MTMAPQTPEQLVVAARLLLGRDDLTESGVWPRSGAVLARQALEEALRILWSTTTPELADTSMRAQLLCATDRIDAETAGQLSYTWAALSRACHHHAYELAPTVGELTGWIDDVDTIVAAVRARSASAEGPV